MQESGGIAGTIKFGFDGFFFVGLEPGGGNFLDLKAEEIELLLVGFFIDDEGRFFFGEGGAALEQGAELSALGGQVAVGIENAELAGGLEERLVVVGPVHIDEPFADGTEDAEGGGGAIYELAVGAGAGKTTFEEELLVFAGVQPVCLEKGGQERMQGAGLEYGFDAAVFLAAANEGAVGASAEDEVEGAEDDGFTRAGFTSDNVATGLEFEREVADESKVFNAKRGQHDYIWLRQFEGAGGFRQKKFLVIRRNWHPCGWRRGRIEVYHGFFIYISRFRHFAGGAVDRRGVSAGVSG